MRVIERQVCGAFLKKQAKRLDNTESTGEILTLFGNTIAKWVGDVLFITTAGRASTTTRSRLRSLGVNVYNHKKQLMLCGDSWDGKWTIAHEVHGLKPGIPEGIILDKFKDLGLMV